MTNNLKQILDNSIDYVLNKNLKSSSMVASLKSITTIKQGEEETNKIITTKLDFKALENLMVNNQFTNDITNKVKESNEKVDDLKESLSNLFSNENIFMAIEKSKHNNYFSEVTFNNNLITGNIELDQVSNILHNNLISEENKEKILLSLRNSNEEEDLSDSKQEETTESEFILNKEMILFGFESTMKWLIVAGIVIGLFIIIFLIIKKNNNKLKNLSKLNTNIKYLSDDSITSSIVDLGTQL
jgi:hypothetical protein